MRLDRLDFINGGMDRGAAFHMAVDEALLFTASHPTLRCYRWSRPAFTFGYFVPWSRVECFSGDRVRRWTGGGIVEHGQDLTYSFILPASALASAAKQIYYSLHQAITELLCEDGHSAEQSDADDETASDSCFEKAMVYDVKIGRMKVAGSAMRRNRQGVLLQGSIQNVQLKPGFGGRFAGRLAKDFQVVAVSSLTIEAAARIAKERYGSLEWNRRV